MVNLLLPAEKGGQQQVVLRSCTENVQLWHPLLAMGDISKPFKIWEWGVFGVKM
jgi:hypothetical protein